MAKPGTKKISQPGQLRIVAGNWRSRLLEIADVEGLRPTPARIRETLFNWLAPRIAGAYCLDLFAGTGALGLEALSRGAKQCVFVERSRRAIATLRRNVASLDASGAEIHEGEALAFLEQPRAQAFDIVFLDPPFADDLLDDLCRLLADGSHLARDARVYIEQDRTVTELELPAGWQVLKTKHAGNVRYSLLSNDSRAGG